MNRDKSTIHQKYSSLLLYFQLESPSTPLVLSDDWAYWHPSWGWQVVPRRQSPSSEHPNCRSLTQHVHPCDILAPWAPAAESLPDYSNEYWEIPPPVALNPAQLRSWPLMPQGDIAEIPIGVGWGTTIKIPGGEKGYSIFLRMICFEEEDNTPAKWADIHLKTLQGWASALQTSTSTTKTHAIPLRTASVRKKWGIQMPPVVKSWLARHPQAPRGLLLSCLPPPTDCPEEDTLLLVWGLEPLASSSCIRGPYHSNAVVTSAARGDLTLSMSFQFQISSTLQCDTHRLT